MKLKCCGYSHFRFPFPLQGLHTAASSQRSKLVFLLSGMLKGQANRTYFNNRHKESVNGGSPSPKGVVFKEEETERGGSLESHVCDLMKNANEERRREKHLNHLSYNKLLPTRIVGIQPVAENETFVVKAADMMCIGLKIKELASVKGKDLGSRKDTADCTGIFPIGEELEGGIM